MNNINRVLVKQQAREIIRGKVFYLFLITLVVGLLTGTGFGFNIDINQSYNELFKNNQNHQNNDYSYYDDFSYEENPIEDFQFNSSQDTPEVKELSVADNLSKIKLSGRAGIYSIICIAAAPLTVTMAGIFLSLVRKRPEEKFELGKEFSGLFGNTFNATYPKKLLVVLLKEILTGLLAMLFVVPGVIFYYSSYFAYQIMSDNPNLKPSEAIKVSKKMVKGNRTELFVLDLSFILWYIFVIVTLGFGSIYVAPYINTTKALYYENFRIRAMQEGRITADDFVSFEEKAVRYASSAQPDENGDRNSFSYTAPPQDAQGYYYTPPKAEEPKPEDISVENPYNNTNE